jgi:hypothetical protein
MVEVLTFSMHEGLNLCWEARHVCATLHLYNVMQQLKPKMGPKRLLDQLCELFLNDFFRGTPPTDKFLSQ